MAQVVGVRFKKAGKIYYFSPDGQTIPEETGVIVETARGLEYGVVVMGNKEVDDSEIVPPLKPIIRVATQRDEEQIMTNEAKREDALAVAEEKAKKHNLDMKLVDVEYTFDGSKIVFYFTAEGRVDFRELVKDLASYFRIRIELRQIGIRDECKMLGGVAPCGRPCCCSNHLTDFGHVSIKMAKNQGLSLNPTKISGLCGRLMCCLEYENDCYTKINKTLPKVGSTVETPDGKGVVISVATLKERVSVRIAIKEDFEIREYPISDIKVNASCHNCPKEQEVEDDDEDILE